MEVNECNGALANLDSVFLVQIGHLLCNRVGLAQNGHIAELQRADEVVHGLAGKRLGAEGTIGVDCMLGDDFDTSWMLVDFAGDGMVGHNYLHTKKIPSKNPDWDELLADKPRK